MTVTVSEELFSRLVARSTAAGVSVERVLAEILKREFGVGLSQRKPARWPPRTERR
jgi:hypothetical protein